MTKGHEAPLGADREEGALERDGREARLVEDRAERPAQLVQKGDLLVAGEELLGKTLDGVSALGPSSGFTVWSTAISPILSPLGTVASRDERGRVGEASYTLPCVTDSGCSESPGRVWPASRGWRTTGRRAAPASSRRRTGAV